MSPPERDPRPRPAWLSWLARALLAAAVARMSPARRPWGQAMLAELDQARGAVEALAWALGGVRVAWLDRHQRMPREARQGAWPVVGAGLGVVAGAVGLLRAMPLAEGGWLAHGWELALVAAGIIGLAAPVLVSWAPGWAALGLGVAGALAVMLGSVGLLPGIGLLAAAAVLAGTVGLPATEPAGAPPAQPSLRRPSVATRAAVAVGLLGHALAGPLVVAMAGLVAPPWALVALAVLWGGLGAAALRARRPRPWLIPALPILTIAVGYAVVSFGMSVLGWLP